MELEGLKEIRMKRLPMAPKRIEAEESTVPPKKQRRNSQGVSHILSYIE
jgi:hypothetical protein